MCQQPHYSHIHIQTRILMHTCTQRHIFAHKQGKCALHFVGFMVRIMCANDNNNNSMPCAMQAATVLLTECAQQQGLHLCAHTQTNPHAYVYVRCIQQQRALAQPRIKEGKAIMQTHFRSVACIELHIVKRFCTHIPNVFLYWVNASFGLSVCVSVQMWRQFVCVG